MPRVSAPILLILVGVGGALGALLRFAVVEVLARGLRCPAWLGIALINVAGGGMIGIASQATLATGMREFLVVGGFGGLTTFSTAMLDVVLLYRIGDRTTALLLWIGTPVLALLAWGVVVSLAGGDWR